MFINEFTVTFYQIQYDIQKIPSTIFQKNFANSIYLLMQIAINQIVLQSPGWSGFVKNSKLDQT